MKSSLQKNQCAKNVTIASQSHFIASLHFYTGKKRSVIKFLDSGREYPLSNIEVEPEEKLKAIKINKTLFRYDHICISRAEGVGGGKYWQLGMAQEDKCNALKNPCSPSNELTIRHFGKEAKLSLYLLISL